MALGAHLGHRPHRHLARCRSARRAQPRHRLRRRHVWQLTVSAELAVRRRRPRRARRRWASPTPRSLILGDDGVRVQAEDLTRRRSSDEVTDALAEYGGVDRGRRERQRRRPDLGQAGQREGAARAHRLLPRDRALPLVPVRVEDGGRPRSPRWSTTSSSRSASTPSPASRSRPRPSSRSSPSSGSRSTTPSSCSTRCRENEATLGTVPGDTYSTMVNRSLNQVLMRSLNTSFVALLPGRLAARRRELALGAVALRDFGLALFVGLLTGAYSSIFVATPILAWRKEREPRYRRRARALGEGAARTVARRVPGPAPRPQPRPRRRRRPRRRCRPRRGRPATASRGRRRATAPTGWPTSDAGDARYVPPPQRPVPASSAARSASSEPGRR